MPELRVDYPKAKAQLSQTFFASGRMSPPDYPLGVDGLLLKSGTQEVAARGRTVLFAQPAPRPGQPVQGPRSFNWVVSFKDVPAGDYDLLVTSFSGQKCTVQNGATDPDSIAVDAASGLVPVSVGGGAIRSISIGWPASDEDISDYIDYFVAYGTFADGHNCVSATMNNIDADFIHSEFGDWAAQFPPLAGATTYTLVVVDSANHNDTRGGLTS